MRRVSFKAVLIGGLTDLLLSTVVGFPFAVFIMLRLALSHPASHFDEVSLILATHASLPLYIAVLGTGQICSGIAGAVAAWLAKHDERLNGALSAFLTVGLSVYDLISGR